MANWPPPDSWPENYFRGSIHFPKLSAGYPADWLANNFPIFSISKAIIFGMFTKSNRECKPGPTSTIVSFWVKLATPIISSMTSGFIR